MGTLRYANAAGSNTAPYDTVVKGATNPQTIIDLAVADDENRYYNTFILAAPLDFDTNAGSVAAGMIYHRGCNAAGDVDGTESTWDGNNAVANCIGACDKGYHWFEHIICTRATGDGINMIDAPDPTSWMFKHVTSHTNGGHGWHGDGGGTRNAFIRCRAYGNTGGGFYDCIRISFFFGNVAYGNGANGFFSNQGSNLYLGNIGHDNGDADVNFYIQGLNDYIINNIADGTDQANETGIWVKQDYGWVFFNRITNCATGLNLGTGEQSYYGYNYFHNNTDDIAGEDKAIPILSDTQVDTNLVDVDADDGYNNVANNDFNLKADRTYNGDGNDVIGLGIGT